MHAIDQKPLYDALMICVRVLLAEPENEEARAQAIALIQELPDGEPVSDEEGLAELARIYHTCPESKRPILVAAGVLLSELFTEAAALDAA